MKKLLVPCVAAVLATAFCHASPSDDVAAAAKKLSDAPNYSWTTTTVLANSDFTPGPTNGQTEKGGYTVISREFNDNTFQTVRKGDKVVMQNRDGDWVTLEEMMQQFGGGEKGNRRRGGRGRMAAATPADEVGTLLKGAKALTVADGVVSGDLTPEFAEEHLSPFGRMRGGNDATPPKATGAVKFWLKDGALAKYEVHVKGTATTRNGDERDIDRTATTEIKDVGTTKVQVPDEAKAKMGSS